MNLILRQGEIGLKQDLLIEGLEYKVYRQGEFLGKATYEKNDPVHGEGFFSYKGRVCKVYCADEWVIG